MATWYRLEVVVDDRDRSPSLCPATSGISDVAATGRQIELAIDGDDTLLPVARSLVDAGVVLQVLVPGS